LFISDLHLDESRPGIVERFERFLAGPAREADALYILGDLFEYWVAAAGLGLPSAGATPATPAGLRGRVPGHFSHGNRACLAAPAAEAAGANSLGALSRTRGATTAWGCLSRAASPPTSRSSRAAFRCTSCTATATSSSPSASHARPACASSAIPRRSICTA